MLKLKPFKKKIITFTITGVLLLSPIVGQAKLGDRALMKGMRHNDIQVLQQHLVDLNHLSLNQTTTYYGNLTFNGVKKFQRANGLQVDGSFGPASFRALNSKISNGGSNNSPSKPSAPSSGYTRALTQGSKGTDVNSLQKRLKALGYLNIANCTNYFGGQTRSALRDFQRTNGLQVDGSAGPATHKVIYSNNAKSKSSTPSKPSTPSSGYTRALTQGSKGTDVNSLQKRLKALGYLNIANCTNYFGGQTRSALRDFQRTNGLQVDGSAGPATHKVIYSNNAKSKSSTPNRGDSSSSTGQNIVSTARRYMGVPYRYGASGPNAFDCSGFTQYVFRQHGISLSRSAAGQARNGARVSKGRLQTGDLVIFSGTYKAGPSHAGIYIGNGNFIHASSSRGVTIDNLNSNYYRKHFSYGRRVF